MRRSAAAALVACLVAVRFHWLSFLPLLYLLRRSRESLSASLAARWVAAAATLAIAIAMPRANGFAGFFAEVGREPQGWRAVFMDERYCGPGMRFLADSGLQGKLYQPFNDGGFLGYFLAPRLRTFIDGRLDHVPARVLDDYLAIRKLSRDGPTAPLRSLLECLGDRRVLRGFLSGVALLGSRVGLPPASDAGVAARLRLAILLDLPAPLSREPRESARGRPLLPASTRVPFDTQRGFDAARARSAAPEWAAVQRIDLADAELLEAWRRGSDATLRRSARAQLADHAWRIGDFASSLAIDEETLAEEPTAFEPALRRVDALLMLGRPAEALEAAQELAAAHPERPKSRRWLARAEKAAARETRRR